MPDELIWQKSSFSGGPQGECVYLAPTPDGTIRLRKSDTPDVILTATQDSLAALLHHARASPYNQPTSRRVC